MTTVNTPSTQTGTTPVKITTTFTAQQIANGAAVATANFTMDTGANIAAQNQLAPFNVTGQLFQIYLQNLAATALTITTAAGLTMNSTTLAASTGYTMTFVCTGAATFTVYLSPPPAGTGGGGGSVTFPITIAQGGTNSTTALTGTDSLVVVNHAGTKIVEQSHIKAYGDAANNMYLTPGAFPGSISSGGSNVALGVASIPNITTGSNNIAITGGAALNTGSYNVLAGALAGNALTSGTENIAIGHQAMTAETTGSGNIAIGFQAAINQTAGHNDCIAIGDQAGGGGGNHTIAIGPRALVSLGDIGCIAIGNQAGVSLAPGVNSHDSVMIGDGVYLSGTEGLQNVIIGANACAASTGDSQTVCIGYNAGPTLSGGGSENVLIGTGAGSGILFGSDNVCIGNAASPNTEVSNCTMVGANSVFGAGVTAGNATAIGAGADCETNNSVVLGFGASVGIGVDGPDFAYAALEIGSAHSVVPQIVIRGNGISPLSNASTGDVTLNSDSISHQWWVTTGSTAPGGHGPGGNMLTGVRAYFIDNTATFTLARVHCGDLFTTGAPVFGGGAAATITLPAVATSRGYTYDYHISGQTSTGVHDIQIIAPANTLFGTILAVAGGNSAAFGSTTITIAHATAVPGDRLEFWCDGTVWMVAGQVTAGAAYVIA